MKNLGLHVFTLVLLAGTVGMWYYCLNSNRVDERDYTSVTGTVTSISAHTTGGKRQQTYLEFRIKEHPTPRFRVSINSYDEYFDREMVRQNVRAGSKITFEVEKAELAKPSRPPLDPEPTVFVYSMRDDQHVYGT